MSNLNKNQSSALDAVLSGHNVLITGPAGTGKSFLISEIVKTCENQGKNVALTCTTGIACSVYTDMTLKANTLHRWSGIEDGRYPPSEIKTVILNNAKYAKVVDNIRNTDILIIDEVSMLSKKVFDSLSEVCSIKNEKIVFGGIQLVLSGDFYQLPPVPNTMYNDEGKYCFESDLFSNVISHKIMLNEVVRQKNETFIKVLQEVSAGALSHDSVQFIKSLNRPLVNSNQESLKLFATNDIVDDFNRDKLLKMEGPVYEYISEDKGKITCLNHVLAPRKLWLKVGAPVILLRNLSNKLVNGLRGDVISISEDGPVVDFHSVGIQAPMKKIQFTVFSLRDNKDIAVREQLPLKLAFAITIHKAQGMTLDKVEVDCRGIFKPGQLGVAMSRARDFCGLRVTNFTQRACMPQPDIVNDFIKQPSQTFSEDLSCCQETLRKTDVFGFTSVSDTPVIPFDTDIDAQCEDQFDSEFEQLINEIDELNADRNLPQDLNLDQIIQDMKTDEVLTPFQDNVNTIITSLNKQKYKDFCCREYNFLKNLNEKMNFTGPVKCADLGDFYTSVHKHHTSAEFLLSCMQLFENESFMDEHKHICFFTSVEIRKFILKQSSENYTSQPKQLVQRTVTDASRTRIRYVGGYCIAKIRFKYIKKKNTVRYSKKPEDQQLYEECLIATEILNQMQVNEQYILANSSEPESLYDITRKQNVNRGLTNISDELFKFFICLSQTVLSIMTTEKFNKHKKDFFENSKQEIINNKELLQSFSTVVLNQSSVDNVSSTPLKVSENDIRTIFEKIVKSFLFIMIAQFRKDMIDLYNIDKKMAHRKQIRVSSKGDSKKSIVDETKDSKKGNDKKSRPKKRKTTDVDDVESSDQLLDLEAPSGVVSVPENEPSTSSEPAPSTSHNQTLMDLDDNDDNILCKKCFTADKEIEWIQCDNCSEWLHRGCAGLKHHLKWKKYKKKGSVYTCNECL